MIDEDYVAFGHVAKPNIVDDALEGSQTVIVAWRPVPLLDSPFHRVTHKTNLERRHPEQTTVNTDVAELLDDLVFGGFNAVFISIFWHFSLYNAEDRLHSTSISLQALLCM